MNPLDRPVVLLGRGGSGTRVLSQVAQRMGIFLGNDINVSGDSVEWVEPVYELSVAVCTGATPNPEWPRLLRRHARDILETGDWKAPQLWGWKLPETMLILPEILTAFPAARIVHLVRHPVTSSLRRTHMTSRSNNPVGQAVLGAAYREIGRPEKRIESDAPWQHNAITWLYQVGRVTEVSRQMDTGRYLEVRFEDLCATPKDVDARIAAFLDKDTDRPAESAEIEDEIDLARAAGEAAKANLESDPRAAWVWSLCAPVAEQFGYASTPMAGGKT